eukprot:SAG31_NODE_14764_length_788_cov_2.447025_2_plen_48_part_01
MRTIGKLSQMSLVLELQMVAKQSGTGVDCVGALVVNGWAIRRIEGCLR